MKQNAWKYDVIVVGGTLPCKPGKSVRLIEAHDELAGATTNVKPFPEYDARSFRSQQDRFNRLCGLHAC